jgi:hypothetical protein
MGNDYYNVAYWDSKAHDWRKKPVSIFFRDTDSADGWSCLCTFPFNYSPADGLDPETVASLAILGAAVSMAHHGDIDADGGYIALPEDVPEWIQQAIKNCVGWCGRSGVERSDG